MRTSSTARIAVSLLLAASGVLLVMADRLRWWPVCQFGDFDSGECLAVQDHAFDVVLPGDGSVPSGNAGTLASVSLLLLAIALTLVPLLIPGPRPGALTLVLSAYMGLGVLAIASLTWLWDPSHGAVTLTGLDTFIASFALFWPLALLMATILPHVRAAQTLNGWLLVTIALLFATTPIPAYMLAAIVMGYGSHDTTPWSEAITGVLLVLAAITWLPASRASQRPPVEEDAAPAMPARLS